MKTIGNPTLTIERISNTHWMASYSVELGEGQRIELSLALPKQPDHTVAQIEQELIRQAVRHLQQKLQD